MRSLAVLALLTTTGLATPTAEIKDGTILGFATSTVDTFLGIPFADPPIGDLRLRRPRPLSKSLGTFNATGIPVACIQKTVSPDLPILQTFPPEVSSIYTSYNAPIDATGEDCLTLNIHRPANLTTTAKLPVLFWIFGGGFESGATSRSDYTSFVASSIALGEPIIIVATNYRLNTFGFLGGKELKGEGNTNLGLRDQRLALEWVQENIGAFGGDPDKVTLWGQSAGSASVYDHLFINGGNRTSKRTGKYLFRAAIMNSATGIPAEPIDGQTAQNQYDQIVSDVGCANTTSTLQCLRAAPYQKIIDATSKVPYLFGPGGFHLNFIPRPDYSDHFYVGSELRLNRSIADVPMIINHQEDEVTTFMVPASEVNTTEKLVSVVQAQYPTAPRAILEKFVSYYNGDEYTGAPFRTNSSQNAYPNSKINSAVLSDLIFIFQHRDTLSHIVDSSLSGRHKSPVWASQGSFWHGFPLLGTFHGSDIATLALGQPEVPYRDLVTSYARFVRYGAPSLPGRNTTWPVYGEKKEMLRLNADGEEVIIDDFREEAYRYFKSVQRLLKI